LLTGQGGGGGGLIGEEGGREVGIGANELPEDDAEESHLEVSQNESEPETDSQMDTSYEVEANPEPVIKAEPEEEVEQPKIQKVEEPKEAPVSDCSSKDVKPEIKPEPIAKEENKDRVILPIIMC
jgi:hypothetical protein